MSLATKVCVQQIAIYTLIQAITGRSQLAEGRGGRYKSKYIRMYITNNHVQIVGERTRKRITSLSHDRYKMLVYFATIY